MTRPLQISICGAARSDAELDAIAARTGTLLAEAGAVLVCGGRGGVMEAAARGAAEAGGTVIGILMQDDPADANPWCTHAVATGIGHARNLAVVASGQAVIAIGGEWGTLTEIGFARRLERTVVTLESWKLTGRAAMAEAPGIEPAATPEAAVTQALQAAHHRATHQP